LIRDLYGFAGLDVLVIFLAFKIPACAGMTVKNENSARK
jgi:uncharacterized membrane protein